MVIFQVSVDIRLAAKDATREIKALMLTNERKMGKGRGEDFATVYDSPPAHDSQAPPAIRHTGDTVVEDDGGGGGGGGGGATFIFRVR